MVIFLKGQKKAKFIPVQFINSADFSLMEEVSLLSCIIIIDYIIILYLISLTLALTVWLILQTNKQKLYCSHSPLKVSFELLVDFYLLYMFMLESGLWAVQEVR